MINIEIKGSCVTREAFNYIDKISEENKKDFEGIVSGEILFEKTKQYHKKVSYFEEILDTKDFVKEKLLSTLPEGKNGFVFVTMGAGDNWKLGTELIKEFRKEFIK